MLPAAFGAVAEVVEGVVAPSRGELPVERTLLEEASVAAVIALLPCLFWTTEVTVAAG